MSDDYLKKSNFIFSTPVMIDDIDRNLVEYDDSGDIGNVKIANKHPFFCFGELIDEILEGWGGVEEIMECKWDMAMNEGKVVCLMKDWRVFNLFMDRNEYSCLSDEERISKINRDCIIHEDLDDWAEWEERGSGQEEQKKKAMDEKKRIEKQTIYDKKMNEAMNAFFNGDPSALVKIMDYFCNYTNSEKTNL